MIKVLHRQSQRYEYPYMNMKNEVEVSVEQHEKILMHLEKGQLNIASALFAENITVGIEVLVDWLKSTSIKKLVNTG